MSLEESEQSMVPAGDFNTNKPLNDMSDEEMMAEVESYPELTDADRQKLERDLYLNHYIRGWTGDPLCQPVRTVLAILRRIHNR